MRYFLNFWWYITLQFVFAIFYAILGGLLFCTIILSPVGLGWLQFAKFLLAPHTQSMVSKEDLALITGKSQGTAMKTLSMVVRILYFPFGLVAAILSIGTIVGMFVSIIGIPNGLVWVKSFSTIFNPINKVCVPRSVAEEIDRIKNQEAVESYIGAEKEASNNTATTAETEKEVGVKPRGQKEAQSVGNNTKFDVRGYSDEKLKEIIGNSDLYNEVLVGQCAKEIEIREKAAVLKEKVASFDDMQLAEVLSDRDAYTEEMIYSCELEDKRRKELLLEQQKRQRELERIAKREKAECIRKKIARISLMTLIILAGVTIIFLFVYQFTPSHHYNMAMIQMEKGKIAKSQKNFERIKEKSKYYELAKGGLYELYLSKGLIKEATATLKEAIRKEDWGCPYYYQMYAEHLLNGDLSPFIEQNVEEAIEFYRASPYQIYKDKGDEEANKLLVYSTLESIAGEQNRYRLQIEEQNRIAKEKQIAAEQRAAEEKRLKEEAAAEEKRLKEEKRIKEAQAAEEAKRREAKRKEEARIEAMRKKEAESKIYVDFIKEQGGSIVFSSNKLKGKSGFEDVYKITLSNKSSTQLNLTLTFIQHTTKSTSSVTLVVEVENGNLEPVQSLRNLRWNSFSAEISITDNKMNCKGHLESAAYVDYPWDFTYVSK